MQALPTISSCQEWMTSSLIVIHQIQEHPITKIVKETIKSIGQFFRLYFQQNPSISPMVTQIAGSPSTWDSSSRESRLSPPLTSNTHRIRQWASIFFIMEIVGVAAYLPYEPFKAAGLTANCFSLIGFILTIKAEVEEPDISPFPSMWEKSTKIVALSTYATSAMFVALKIIKTFASGYILAKATSAATFYGWLSVCCLVVKTSMYLIENKKEVNAKLIAIWAVIKPFICSEQKEFASTII